MENIFKKDLSGALVSPNEPGYDELINSIFDTMKLAYELNTGYHSPEEVRDYLSQIIGRKVDESVTLLPPFYGGKEDGILYRIQVFVLMI